MTSSACPATNTLQLLLDEMDAEESEELLGHLESCTLCQESLQTLAGDLSAWRFTAAGLQQAARYEPALLDVIHRLKDEDVFGVDRPTEDEDLSYLQPTDQAGVLGLLGAYEVQEVIGRGGMGIVLKATDPPLGRTVALKVLAPLLATSPSARRRFLREGRAAARVVHDHIVTVFGVHEAGGLPFLVMQHIEGESLHERLEREGPLEVVEIVRIAHQAASGLAAAHEQGLIHRDIKPANLLLEVPRGPASAPVEERVRITDFGLARMAGDVQVTQQGMVIGTPEYMAPEQARSEPLDHRADLFSLGSVIYAMCTGRSPFHASTAVAVLRKVCDEMPASLRSLNPAVPKWLEEIVERLMQKNPEGRFQHASEVAALLAEALAGKQEPRIPPPMRSPARGRPRRPRRWVVGLTALFLLSLGALALWGWGPFPRHQEDPPDQRAQAADQKQKASAEPKKDRPPAQPAMPPKFAPPTPEQVRAVGLLKRLNARFQFDALGRVVHVVIPTGTEVDGLLEDLLPLTHIHNFSLQGSKITDADMKHLAGFKNMHQLYLGQTAITDAGVKELAPCEQLQFLGLENTHVSDAGIKALANLKNLKYLNVGGTAITDASLKEIGAFHQMGFLCLYSTGVSDAGMKELQRLTELHTLLINDTEVSDAGLKELAPLRVRRIDAKNTAVTEAGLKALREATPGVKVEWEPGSLRGGADWMIPAVCVAVTLALLAAALGVYQKKRQSTARRLPGPERGLNGPPACAVAPPIFFCCAHCQHRLRAKPDKAGKRVKCPRCGSAVEVPSLQANLPPLKAAQPRPG
jgi:serine/threonine-protein kinase